MIFSIGLCLVVGGFLFGLVHECSTNFETLCGLAIMVGIFVGLVFGIGDKDFGAGCSGCIGGVIAVIIIAIVCVFIPPALVVVVGAIIGALMGLGIGKEFTKK